MISLFLIVVLAPCVADFRFGQDLFNDGLYEEAVAEFERVIAFSPTSPEARQALFLIGESYRKQKDFSRAEDAYMRLWEGYPVSSFKDKTLYSLALVQFQQKKYRAAGEHFAELITAYPLSEYVGDALIYSVQAYYFDGDYNQVIIASRKYIKNYSENAAIPEVLFWKAKACFANNMPAEGRKTLDTIISNYPTAPAQWRAFEFQMELLKNEEGIQAAVDKLVIRLQDKVPRAFEERLRSKLIGYYMQQGKYREANIELTKLISKFNNSANLDRYIIDKCTCDIEMGLYDDVLAMQETYRVVFKESPLKDLFTYYYAAAQFHLERYEEARQQLDAIIESSTQDSVTYISTFLSGAIKEKQGRQKDAIDLYKSLLNKPYSRNEELLYAIGSIYYQSFGMYTTALNYFHQIMNNYANPRYQAKAAYQAALCLEQMEDFDGALKELQSLSLPHIQDAALREKISRKRYFYSTFRKQDYQHAFGSLLDALYRYLDTSDRADLQQNIVRILAQDLKAYEEAIAIADGSKRPQLQYEQARIYLKLIQRQQFESLQQDAAESLKKLNRIISNFDDTQQDEWIRELQIKRRLVMANIDTTVIADMKDFINHYPTAQAAHEFRLSLGEYYQQNHELAKGIPYFEALQQVPGIDSERYFQAKITAAEFYYAADNDARALALYRLADRQIKLSQPQVYFHYAVVLNESGATDDAIDKLAFLINNADDFAGFDNTISYFSTILRKAKKYDEAIKYQLLIPINRRTDALYQSLANDYLALGNREKAKESLMYIQGKNQDILQQLAKLQLQTGDLTMAAYSYGQLAELEPKNLGYIESLGHIAFAQERYLDAAIQYKKIVDSLGDNFASYPTITTVARENIIALYRVGNRPKAEALTRKFGKKLSDADMHKIALNEGIYYKDIDKKVALKKFNKLLKEKTLSDSTRMDALFWRGILHVENRENELALADFKSVTAGPDMQLRKQAYLKLGTINFSMENFDQALADYFYVIQNDDDGKLAFDAARNFAFVCKRLKQWQKAVSAYEIILDRWGDTGLQAETLFDIAFCHYRDKKYNNAIEMFRNAVSLLDDDAFKAEAQYWIGESYCGLDLYETAITEFLKVSYNYPTITDWAASAELRAGECYLRLKQFTKARSIFQRVISKFGAGSNYGRQASEHLKNL